MVIAKQYFLDFKGRYELAGLENHMNLRTVYNQVEKELLLKKRLLTDWEV